MKKAKAVCRVIRARPDSFTWQARQGFDKAELIVGVNYLTGDDGLPNDRQQAIGWLRKAAAQDSPFARDLLVVLSDRSAPASFANIAALGAYLTRLRNQEMARIAARSGGYRQDTNVVARINAAREMTAWNASAVPVTVGALAPAKRTLDRARSVLLELRPWISTYKSASVHECVRSNRCALLGMSLHENRRFHKGSSPRDDVFKFLPLSPTIIEEP
jgi:hypothetical protein